jgi:hypothetical protein
MLLVSYGRETVSKHTLMRSQEYRLERLVGTGPFEEKTISVNLVQRQRRVPGAHHH